MYSDFAGREIEDAEMDNMREDRMDKNVLTGVRQATKDLTIDELVALCLLAWAGVDPREMDWYEKVKGLFTEAGGTKVHSEVMKALDIIITERICGEEEDCNGHNS